VKHPHDKPRHPAGRGLRPERGLVRRRGPGPEGRINGYLSSVQDDLLTGYGTVTPPDVTGAAGQALMALLDEVAPVYPETRRWFLQSYGQLRSPTAFDLARRILEAPLDVDDVDILAADWAGELLERQDQLHADGLEELEETDAVANDTADSGDPERRTTRADGEAPRRAGSPCMPGPPGAAGHHAGPARAARVGAGHAARACWSEPAAA
jgi:hypothetical protein